MKIKTYLASECGAKLDSDVIHGGGTDDTAVLQAILDRARDSAEGVRLIVDGAALIRGLKVYSNTTIECLSASCGFYLMDQSNCALVSNGNQIRKGEMVDENICLIGGTYNQNCPNQVHDIPRDDLSGFYKNFDIPGMAPSTDLVVAMFFVGVRGLTLRDLVIRDQRTYAAALSNWEHVRVENVEIQLPNRVHAQNQDGFHFFGPGRFLDVRNVGGRTSDDLSALAPDELDGESAITDVSIDGVHLDDADQAIRMLCHKNGVLDRVVIKNVTGTYRSFGFFINPFFPSGVKEGCGYRNIVIDTVDLRSNGLDYDYTPPFLFRVGGRVDSLILRNITHYCPGDDRPVLDVGLQYYQDTVEVRPGTETRVMNLVIDGLNVIRQEDSASGDLVVARRCKVQNLLLRNINVVDQAGPRGALVRLEQGAEVARLRIGEVDGGGLETLLCNDGGQVEIVLLPTD